MHNGQSIHASCVAIDGQGVLLRGASGAGKSDLALRLIHEGAKLVSDDQVVITRNGNMVFASPPAQLAGLLEIRGMGIFRLDYQPDCPVVAVFDLQSTKNLERMPDKSILVTEICGITLPCWPLEPFGSSATARIFTGLTGAVTC